MWSTTVTLSWCVIFLLASKVVLVKVCMGSRDKFMITLLLLQMAGLYCAIIENITLLDAIDKTKDFSDEPLTDEEKLYLRRTSLTRGICLGLSQFFALFVAWKFSIKYWVVSREMPRLFEGEIVNLEV